MSIQERVRTMFPAEGAIPEAFSLGQPLEQREYLIDGEIRCWEGAQQEVLSPICVKGQGGERQVRLGSYPMLTGGEAEQALQAALKAYDRGRGLWPTMTVEGRIRHVEEFIRRMREKRAEVVKLLMWEIGKTLEDSEKEFDRTVDYLKDTIEACKELDRASSRPVITQGILAQIRRAPFGVALCMGPFNYPLNETFATLLPALIMGNTVIFKPPKLGVLLHRPLLEAFRDSFPRGVVNTVYGDGGTVVGPLMTSGKLDVLAFIGSSRVGDILKRQHPAPHRLRCVLGLEAKNVAIVLNDADLDTAVSECVLGALSYNGQRCTALKLLYLQSKIAEPFLARFIEAVSKLAFGMPWDKGVKLTPLPEPGKTDLLRGYVEDARKCGAEVVNEGGATINQTFFFPAVLFQADKNMKIFHEEQFGPVVPVARFDDPDTPVQHVIESNYGQQVSLFGRDPARVAQLIDPLVNQVCRVNINSQCQRGPDVFPFTGRKDSAEGTLSVSDALRVFTIRTLVAAKQTDQNKELLGEIIRGHKSNFLSTEFIL